MRKKSGYLLLAIAPLSCFCTIGGCILVIPNVLSFTRRARGEKGIFGWACTYLINLGNNENIFAYTIQLHVWGMLWKQLRACLGNGVLGRKKHGLCMCSVMSCNTIYVIFIA